ncbi:hypothetical protein X907_1528 [Glycocaulis alkaliphilus]|uniref:Uncharacterized protein n=1 Tax=Glycocaulis alkaliphilus TaxID=1434191 RepID=A0A3T0E9J3_9PROT|nr:hypothetical protein X907_1528 [Glycocaulis alkaliphilus]
MTQPPGGQGARMADDLVNAQSLYRCYGRYCRPAGDSVFANH